MIPLFVPETSTVILDYVTRYTHPVTGEIYGGADYGDPAKIAQIGAVPLRVVAPTKGLEVVEWLVEDDKLNIGGKKYRPVMLYVQLPPDGEDAATWEIVDDPAHPGDKLKRPATTTPWVISPADLAAKKEAGTRVRKLKLEALTVSYNGWTFQADPQSRANLTAIITAIMAGIPVSDPFPWRDEGDVDRLLTHAQLVALGGAMLLATLTIYQKSWALKDALAAVTDPLAFRAVDVAADVHWK